MEDAGSSQNPYRAPRARVRDVNAPRRRSIGLLIVATIEAIIGTSAAIMVPRVIDQFEQLFKGFGADLPGPTRFMLATKFLWWLFGIVGIAVLVWIVRRRSTTPGEHRRQLMSVVAYTLAFCVAWGLLLYFLYLPIFRLGAVV